MIKCKICGKECKDEEMLKRHVTTAYGKEVDKRHCLWLAYRARNMGDDRFSKENIKHMYYEDRLSSSKIAKKLGVYKHNILKLMSYYGISRRSRSEASENQIKRDGLWNKGLTKYDHPSIMKVSQERMGKNNPFYKKEGFEERKRKLYLSGVIGRKRALKGSSYMPSTTEKRFKKILEKNNISYNHNFTLKYMDGQNKKRWYFYDFKVFDNIIFELNGDYWHANPSFYKANDKVNIRSCKVASDIWEADKKKEDIARQQGYTVVCLWENDIKSMTDDEVLDFILEWK